MARINARLDEAMSQKLEALRKLTGKSTSDILKGALELYFQRASEQQSPLQIMKRHGFVGSAAGEPDLSSDYKALLTKLIEQKT
jgi:hypothetical protein